MQNVQFNELIKNNKILYYFLDNNKTFKIKLIRSGAIFLFIPLLLLFLTYYHQTLLLKSEGHIGMLDDSLFLFAVFLVPIQLFILNIVINKFLSFLKELPSFTKNINNNELYKIVIKYKAYISKKRPVLIIAKVIIIAFFLFSNIKSLYFREGAWNSPDQILEFVLTILFLVVLFSVLIEILIEFLLIIIAQIKLTTELNQNNLIDIEPLSLDKSGSLKSLGELSLSFTFILIPFIISGMTHYMTWRSLTIGFTAGIILLSSSTIFLFFFPLGTVHTLMRNSKKEFLKEIDKFYILACDKLLNEIKLNKENITDTKEYCVTIKELYDKGKEMPVWPFDFRIIIKFLTILLGPLALILIEFLMQMILQKLF